jgi:hypothetical protein
MADEFDFSDLTPDQVNSGGGSVVPGYYHVVVEKVAEETAKKGHQVRLFELKILDGTVKGCKGLKIFERLHLTANTKQRAARFAKVLGLITDQQLGVKGPVTIDWQAAKYRQCVVQVVPQKDENTGKPHATYTQVDFMGIFSLTDERVAHVPKYIAGLREAGLSAEEIQRATTPQANGAGSRANGASQPALPMSPAERPAINTSDL